MDQKETWSGLRRRQFVKYAGAAGLTATAAGCIGDDDEVDIGDDPNETVDGRSITLAMDEGHNTRPMEWLTDDIEADTGVTLEDIQGFPFGGLFENLMTEFQAGSDEFDLVSFFPQNLGTFAANEHLAPIDDFLEIDGWDHHLDDVFTPFRELYTTWGESTYTLPIDGDVLMLVYREDLFNQHDIDVPETWSEFNEAARYFTEETNDVEYGVATYGDRSFNYGWFLARFGSAGGQYFDEDMNPQINSDAGRDALEHWGETLEYAPPETVGYGYDELRDAFVQGNVAMVIQWTDVPKQTGAHDVTRGNWGGAAIPGWDGGDGTSPMVVGRTLGIPSYISDGQKLAAYRWAQRFHHPDYSAQYVSDLGHGLDPWMEPHVADPELYTQSADFNEVDDAAPFDEIEEGEKYVEALEANLGQGFPEPYWPGAAEYTSSLAVHLSDFLAGETGVDETLENIEDDWEQTVENLGREEQQEHYQTVLDAWERAGLL